MNLRKQLPWSLKAAQGLLGVAFVAAFKNAADEPYTFLGASFVALIWIFAPLLLHVLRVFDYALGGGGGKVLDMLLLAYSSMLSLAYLGYAFNGATDPDTAAHMHLLLVPMSFGLLALPLLSLVAAGLLSTTAARGPGLADRSNSPAR